MTTDRKNFIFTARRGIMAEIEYPGVAQLVGRDIWDVEVGCSSHLTRTKIPLKSTISEGFSYSLSIAAQEVSMIIRMILRQIVGTHCMLTYCLKCDKIIMR